MTKETKSGEYYFIGENGSLGYKTGYKYDLLVRQDENGEVSIISRGEGRYCIYTSWITFFRNWTEVDKLTK